MKYVTILDFAMADVHVFPFDSNTTTAEEVMEANGHKESECQWMITDSFSITVHKLYE